MNLEPDHFLIASPSLETGIDHVKAIVGKRPIEGGSHPGQGTCNALLRLGDRCYLEIIAPDANQDASTPIRHYLSSLTAPALMWWAVRCEDVTEISDHLRGLGIPMLEIVRGSRKRPDGIEIGWKLMMPEGRPYGISLPFFIEWDVMAVHPTDALEVSGLISAIRLSTPHAESIRPVLGKIAEVQSGDERIEITLELATKSAILRSPENPGPCIGSLWSPGASR